MATHATTATIGIVAADVTFPTPAGPAQRHQRLNLTNLSAADIWVRVDGTNAAAAIAGDECAVIPPGGFIELEFRATASVIAAAAGSKLNIWGRP